MSISKKDLFVDDKSGIDYLEGNKGPAQRRNSLTRSKTPPRTSLTNKDGANFRDALMGEPNIKNLTVSQSNSASNTN